MLRLKELRLVPYRQNHAQNGKDLDADKNKTPFPIEGKGRMEIR
jgi:hypothetical protein